MKQIFYYGTISSMVDALTHVRETIDADARGQDFENGDCPFVVIFSTTCELTEDEADTLAEQLQPDGGYIANFGSAQPIVRETVVCEVGDEADYEDYDDSFDEDDS